MEKKSSKPKVSLSVTQLAEKDSFQVQASGTQVDNIACLAMAVKGISDKSGLSVRKILAIVDTVLNSDEFILSKRGNAKQKEARELALIFADVLDELFGGK